MAESIVCEADPRVLHEVPVCLSSVSKDVMGKMALRRADKQECSTFKCITLKTIHELNLSLKAAACDSPTGKLFDGKLVVPELISAYEAGSGNRRGVHTGLFQWQAPTASIAVTGTLSGTTNAGLFRPPFQAHEKCLSPGIMYGRLCGTVEKANDKKLVGCEVLAVYRFSFPASEKGGEGPVRGTLEGEVVCRC